MTGARPIDLAIVGGGLAGSLIALALRARRPELRVVVIEEAARAGGNQLWSCFAEDVAPADRWLIEPLIVHGWGGYDVRFPGQERRLPSSYATLTSERLGMRLHRAMPEGDLLFDRAATALTPNSVTLADGRVIEARGVIDARGPGDMSALELGYQKFVGASWLCHTPHGLAEPIIMDATVDQQDGYRFVYTLPLSPTELFIEDTYYADGPALDEPVLAARIAAYAQAQGWEGAARGHSETGVLPVCMGGDFARLWEAESPGVAKAGLRGGFFHALTGYSLPDAVRNALAIAAMDDLSGPALHQAMRARGAAHWRGQAYYRMLSRLLFHAAEPQERWRVLARFYRLDPSLIARFYAGQSTLFDKLRVLTGKPPVPVSRAISALGATRG
ncbi:MULTISPECIES: lycopene beta-cyclase CrtY [unclassified Sphingobium]|uniref:lycopene beta-cyclase CrtY n=1 Tax=unclassified Sphingobium TaxID=2611147 RepID=UPI0022258C3F|nr:MULTISPECIES: lycopene beta-cyclase CrtY [unclassified Sphingobium]MCW2412971.1 lycopene beta-cyclase [Sphingobium sp. B8D3D]MCW2414729.1 lycopene beta-cyclase [Sphingobium sp. B8D3A]